MPTPESMERAREIYKKLRVRIVSPVVEIESDIKLIALALDEKDQEIKELEACIRALKKSAISEIEEKGKRIEGLTNRLRESQEEADNALYEAKHRIEELEAKLDKAVEGLAALRDRLDPEGEDINIVLETLAAIRGK